MENIVTLNSLHYFNAHTRSTDDVVNTFIARQKELQELEEGILSESVKSIPQHYMVIGSRGMGKSTLLRRLEISLHTSKMASFVPILFPEEQYNIDRLSKFWLNSLDALADSLESENQHTLTKELDQTITKLSDISEEASLSEAAYQTLCDFCKKIKRRPVFLIDNIDILFEGISTDEQFKLRKLITSNAAPIFVGASTQNPKESQNYDAAFYDAFDNIYLDRLGRVEMRELLLKLADRTGRDEIISEIYEKTGQLDALHNLTGGNPRVAVFLFQLIVNGLSDKIYENLNTLLDVITPLYKANFEQLSKQAQVIVDALALNWDPCDLDMLSQVTRLENNQLSAQLDRLIKSGWIERNSRFSVEKSRVLSKVKNYAVRERFFNIWYIMRRASRRQRGDLKSLTCFLETFYTPQHLELEKKRIVKLIKENIDTDRVIYALALSKTFHLSESNPLEEQIFLEILEHTNADPEKIAHYFNPQSIPDSVYINYMSVETDRWLKRIYALEADNQSEQAIAFLHSIIDLPDRSPDYFIWMKLGDQYDKLQKQELAKEAYLKSIDLNPDTPWPHYSLAVTYQKLGNYEDSEREFLRAIEIDPTSNSFHSKIARFYSETDRINLAEQHFLKAIEIDPKDVYSWVFYSYAFSSDKEKSRDILSKGLEQVPDAASLLYIQAIFYWEDKNPEAEQLFNRAIALAPELAEYWYTYANYLYDQENFESANAAYRKAIELEPGNLKYMEKFVIRLMKQGDHFIEAERLQDQIIKISPAADKYFRLSGISMANGNFDKAIEMLKKVTEMDEENKHPQAWTLLGAFAILNEDFQTAAINLDIAKEKQKDDFMVWNSISHLYHFNLPDYSRAMEAYIKSLEIKPDSSSSLLELVILSMAKLKNVKQAEVYFQTYHSGITTKDLSYDLTEAVLSVAKHNFGDAKGHWTKILSGLDAETDNTDIVDLKFSVAFSQHAGFGKDLIELFENTQTNKSFRPLYEALVALETGSEDYLLNIAAEVSDAARKIFRWMSDYLSDDFKAVAALQPETGIKNLKFKPKKIKR